MIQNNDLTQPHPRTSLWFGDSKDNMLIKNYTSKAPRRPNRQKGSILPD